jgi:thiol-disulfide isomerase/thioredoxin
MAKHRCRLRLMGPMLCCLAATSAGWAGQTNAKPAIKAGLPDGWRQSVEVPSVTAPDAPGLTLLAGATLKLSVEKGWLVVDRETLSGELEWKVVLARADNPKPPEVQVDKSKGNLELRYGNYFIRDNYGALRVLREPKTDKSPPWPQKALDPQRTARGSVGQDVHLTAWESGDWVWAESGLRGGLSDVWVRLNHKELWDGNGFSSRGRLVYLFYGLARLQDEGDLLVAERAIPEMVEHAIAAKKLRKEMGDKPAPALVTREWFNTPAELSLDKLHGKIVLVDFWGKWCEPCVEKLPRLEALHQKYKGRGLQVIGIHSINDSESVGEFLKDKKITFAVAVDKGETAQRYAVQTWPTYFLIDKAGKVVWGFSSDLPPESKIEELLGQSNPVPKKPPRHSSTLPFPKSARDFTVQPEETLQLGNIVHDGPDCVNRIAAKKVALSIPREELTMGRLFCPRS